MKQIDKQLCLKQAVEITKEYVRGGSTNPAPSYHLEELYKKLKELSADAAE